MKAKHTPGPWTSGERLFTGDLPIFASEFGGAKVAVVDAWRSSGEANARLIAAAPDLLNWCRSVVSMGILRKDDEDGIRAAIARATGGE